jgi:hypothetical protein
MLCQWHARGSGAISSIILQSWQHVYRCTNSCIWNTGVTWQGVDYKLSEDDMIVSKHVAVWYEGVSKIFRTDVEKMIKVINKRVWKLPTFTQLRATWHTDSLDMVFIPFTGALRYHNCCIDGGRCPEYFG